MCFLIPKQKISKIYFKAIVNQPRKLLPKKSIFYLEALVNVDCGGDEATRRTYKAESVPEKK